MSGVQTGNIFLVGPMGAGKTTVGKLLAKHLDKTFIDADHELERRTGVDIALIFEMEGESGFRAREAKLLEELATRQNTVLATGGGAVLSKAVREALRRNGTVVYLRAEVAELRRRTGNDKTRPLLQTTDPENKLREILEQRDPLYREIADLVVESGRHNVHRLAKQLAQTLAAREA
ncbi:MAG: shikimate kinase [Burkholderiales bacterium]